MGLPLLLMIGSLWTQSEISSPSDNECVNERKNGLNRSLYLQMLPTSYTTYYHAASFFIIQDIFIKKEIYNFNTKEGFITCMRLCLRFRLIKLFFLHLHNFSRFYHNIFEIPLRIELVRWNMFTELHCKIMNKKACNVFFN